MSVKINIEEKQSNRNACLSVKLYSIVCSPFQMGDISVLACHPSSHDDSLVWTEGNKK